MGNLKIPCTSQPALCPLGCLFVILAPLFVILAPLFVIPAHLFVIPALSRDPEQTADFCKGQRATLDPGSSPGMPKEKVR